MDILHVSAYDVRRMAHRYARNPIMEAIFEFAPRGVARSAEMSAEIENDVHAVYTGKREDVAPGVAFAVQQGPVGTFINVNPAPTRRRLWLEDGSRMVQFASDLCALNILRPYTHYVDYAEAMEAIVRSYAARALPTGVLFLGQRYVNEIVLPDADADPAAYFFAYPTVTGIKNRQPPFAVQLQTEQTLMLSTVLSLSFAGFDPASRPRYILDLYVRSPDNPPFAFEWRAMRAWHDEAHESITRVFEGALRPACNALLGKEATTL